MVNHIVDTNSGLVDGQNKCEKCGSTDVSLNVQTGMLRCHFCRHEQVGVRFEKSVKDITQLKGQIIGSGAADIAESTDDLLTFKCSSCDAEVIVDTFESTQARCHWCRNMLSVNEQISNGAVPDKVLPFAVKKDDVVAAIEKFVSKRKFFAHPKFKEEFIVDNVMGVYLPYMVIDANVGGKFEGIGEVELRRWTESRTVGTGKNRRTVTTTYYDANRYEITRKFDMTVENLTIESSAEKLQHTSSNRTNNIVNAIKPFDVSKAMRWDANYMTGYAAEKRDMNIDDLRGLVDVKLKDIARHNIRSTVKNYDRGVRWKSENLDVIGKQWKVAYFPIWLYSYQMENKTIHYVAVNGQTLKTMGSVPIHGSKLFSISLLFGLVFGLLIGILSGIFILDWVEFDPEFGSGFMLIWTLAWIVGITYGYWSSIYSKYRNKGARYEHERDANAEIRNMKTDDTIIKKLRRTTSTGLSGANSGDVKYKGGSS